MGFPAGGHESLRPSKRGGRYRAAGSFFHKNSPQNQLALHEKNLMKAYTKTII
jgi:hypothetical protein